MTSEQIQAEETKATAAVPTLAAVSAEEKIRELEARVAALEKTASKLGPRAFDRLFRWRTIPGMRSR